METVTFYSYKGGVGRTLALKNYAIFLAKYGFNVCIVDFDLEAPGLHYKFRKYLSENEIKGKKGLVDIIYEYQEKNVIPDNFKDFVLQPKIGDDLSDCGSISILAAGDSMSEEYWQKLSSISWQKLFYQPGMNGDLFFLELKQRIENEIKPDFLLIDSRTGITEVGGICTSLLPDKVVFLICNNDENKEGARLILRGLQKVERPWAKPINVIFVLSRFPPLKDAESKKELDEKELILNEILDFINESFEENASSILIDHINVISSDRDLEQSESEVTNVEPLYTKLFLDISPKLVKDKIAKGIKYWAK